MAKVPGSASELFNDMIPKGLEKNPDKAKEVGAIYMFRITGDGGGDWVVDLTGDPPTCKSGTTDGAQCTIEVDHTDFKRMMAEPQAGMELYFSGKLRVSGDPMLATKLTKLLQAAG